MERIENLILIGFMGCGKTTIGEALAKQLKIPMKDTDKLIEEQQNCTIQEIFSQQGEEAFRKMETKLLLELVESKERKVLSTGGGLPLREENVALLKQIGCIIFLDVDKDTVLNRLQHDTTRPLLQGANVEAKVEELLVKRRSFYTSAADIVVNVNYASVKQIVNEICAKVG